MASYFDDHPLGEGREAAGSPSPSPSDETGHGPEETLAFLLEMRRHRQGERRRAEERRHQSADPSQLAMMGASRGQERGIDELGLNLSLADLFPGRHGQEAAAGIDLLDFLIDHLETEIQGGQASLLATRAEGSHVRRARAREDFVDGLRRINDPKDEAWLGSSRETACAICGEAYFDDGDLEEGTGTSALSRRGIDRLSTPMPPAPAPPHHPLVLPCGHSLGATCAREWLRLANTCPTCRAIVDPLAQDEWNRENDPRRGRGRAGAAMAAAESRPSVEATQDGRSVADSDEVDRYESRFGGMYG